MPADRERAAAAPVQPQATLTAIRVFGIDAHFARAHDPAASLRLQLGELADFGRFEALDECGLGGRILRRT